MTDTIQTTISSVRDANKTIYFLGCSGIGLSALMQYFHGEGFRVTGSCDGASPVTDMLIEHGVTVHTDHSADYITHDIGAAFYTVAVPDTHPELVALRAAGIPVYTYSQGLGYISQNKKTIAVAGTHGKTSTTAMIAQVLTEAGLSPTVIVGSLLAAGGSNYVAGSGEWFVVESCEYHRSFHDIHPTIAIVTNIDNDHLDYYGDMDSLVASFRQFGQSATDVVISHAELPHIRQALGPDMIDASSIDVDITLRVPGDHMRANAQLVLALAQRLGIDSAVAKSALSQFSGTWRRSQSIGTTAGGAVVYDDYGHHPTEITATLSGFKQRFADRMMTVIFQPHLYSRTQILFDDFVDSLAIADRVYVAPIYAAREVDTGTVSSQMIVDALRSRGIIADMYTGPDQLAGCTDHDLIMTVGAGDIYKQARLIVG